MKPGVRSVHGEPMSTISVRVPVSVAATWGCLSADGRRGVIVMGLKAMAPGGVRLSELDKGENK